MSTLLVILDGWGQNPDSFGNAILQASTPNYDYLKKSSLSTLLKTDGPSVGLPEGQCGNSEVGHLTIGLGRALEHPRLKICTLLQTSLKNKKVVPELQKALVSTKAVHLIGLHSAGGIHGLDTLTYLWCQFYLTFSTQKIYLHLITDGRDIPYGHFKHYLGELKKKISDLQEPRRLLLATLTGRFYAMDRDKNFQRTQRFTQAFFAQSPKELQTKDIYQTALEQLSFVENKSEEFLPPIMDVNYPGVADGDLCLNMNFRSDRSVQFYSQIKKDKPELTMLSTVCLGFQTQEQVLCPQHTLEDTLHQKLVDNKISQLRLTESEKEPHVTFFFDGLTHVQSHQYKKKIFPSIKTVSWDQAWPMRALEIASYAQQALYEREYDFILINFVNADLVGHSGDFKASVKAIEQVDKALGIIHKSLSKDDHLLLTADHGNAEQMLTCDGRAHTAHTKFPVELLYKGSFQDQYTLKKNADLSFLASSIAQILQIPQSPLWSESLFVRERFSFDL